jgi:uncharacterized membrane protein
MTDRRVWKEGILIMMKDPSIGGIVGTARFTVLLSLMVLLWFGSPSIVSAETYHGKVVDAETGEPLKGAVVAVVWHKKPILAMGGINYFHNARETLTDSEGRFS